MSNKTNHDVSLVSLVMSCLLTQVVFFKMKLIIFLFFTCVEACKEKSCENCLSNKGCAFFGNKSHEFCGEKTKRVQNIIIKAVRFTQCVHFRVDQGTRPPINLDLEGTTLPVQHIGKGSKKN